MIYITDIPTGVSKFTVIITPMTKPITYNQLRGKPSVMQLFNTAPEVRGH